MHIVTPRLRAPSFLWLALALSSCSSMPRTVVAAAAPPTLAETRAIAKEAFVYGFPLVTNYETLYKQAVDQAGKEYRAPFNTIGRTTGVATPADKFVVTPNSDTPYSFLWLDLRAEPIVVSMPKIDKGRYYSGQLIDLYTYNSAYLGTRSFGNEGGDFLITGPDWKEEAPGGFKAVFRSETEIAYLLLRTQLFNPADMPNVLKVEQLYAARPLSAYYGRPAPPTAPAISWPPPSKDMTTSPELFTYLNFLLQFCPTVASEEDLMARFARIGVGAGEKFDVAALAPDVKKAMEDGIADAWVALDTVQKQIDSEAISSSNLFGTRQSLRDNYLYRFAGAKFGLYGNSGAEAIYLAYFTGADKKPCDASKTGYTLRFPEGQLPPARAFWSLTMYDGRTQLLVANPLQRYLLNSTMLQSFQYGSDGSLTFYLQKDSPGADKQANWLPAPNGPFYAILRIYMPRPEVGNGIWRKPPLKRAK